MRDLFRNLGFTVTLEGAEWAVNVPSRRPDISLQADLVEEIARLYGYDNIPSTLPTGPVTTAARDARQRLLEHVRNALVTRGMYEVRTYAFTSPEVYEALGLEEGHPLRKMIPLAYPMSDERRVLRTHMLPSLGEVARHNLSHRVDGGAIFEFGRCYEAREWPIQTQPREREVIAMMWFGSVPDSLYERARAYDFFDAKGAIEQLVTGLGIAVQYERAQVSWLHPGRSAAISSNGVVIGYVGEIHPSTAAAYDLQTSVYAELDVEMLLQQRPGAATVEALPRFPGARRDLALLVNKDVLVGQMLNEISKVSQVHEILRSARVFDVYAGQGVAADQKSVALALHFGANERTLTDAEMEEVVQDVIASLQDKFDARLRA
ncbi:phenylalanine--tRNA ligase subunit beta [Alicyclobacillus fastidiosus]|nr:phenylalanine--tRNA ligase subunit beta [Alicyclobacillus fastidiosus]